MEYSWVKLGKYYSQIGRVVKSASPDKVVIVIPGNPGLPRFYEDFALGLDNDFPEHQIYVLSNLGGVGNGPKISFQDKRAFMLEGQVRHKEQLIRHLCPNAASITLVGHSIGAYMCLHLLGRIDEIEKVVGITPTIERMEQSPQGAKMTFHFTHLIHLFTIAFFIVSLLPQSLRGLIVQLKGAYPPCVHRCIRDEFLTSTAIWTAFFMAESEMVQVTDRPDSLLDTHSSKINLYYAVEDSWAPLSYYKEVKAKTDVKGLTIRNFWIILNSKNSF